MDRSIEDSEDFEALAALWAAAWREEQLMLGLLDEEI